MSETASQGSERRSRRPASSPKDGDLRTRRVALEVLTAVEQGARSDVALAHRLRQSGLETRDRALVTRLVYGTLAWQAQLDHQIDRLARRPGKIDPRVRNILRMAVLQLGHFDRVPDHAAVDTAVRLCRSVGRPGAAGFVNAVLRRWCRERDSLEPGNALQSDPVAVAALRWSHPEWLVRKWVAELGPEETSRLLAADNEPAPTALRVRRGDRDQIVAELRDSGADARVSAWAPAAILVEAGVDPHDLAPVRDGRCVVQGEASQLVVALAGVRPGDRVLDACAAPGGKTLALGEVAGEGGNVIAVDRSRHGVLELWRRARAAGLTCVHPVVADFRTWTPPAGRSTRDVVVVDAPCSGLGTLRQHPEIRWRQSPERIRELAGLQQELLETAALHVRPGGCLVYATCTISREENEEVVEAFLRAHPEWRVAAPPADFPPAAVELIDAGGFLRTWPHRHGLDGFFAARLVRSER